MHMECSISLPVRVSSSRQWSSDAESDSLSLRRSFTRSMSSPHMSDLK